MKGFLKIGITANSAVEREVLIAQLSETGFYAFEEQESELLAYIEESHFDEQVFLNIVAENRIKTKEYIEEENWNAKWEKDFTPVVINNFAAIRAEFHKPFKNVKHDLLITPKMSFGTGHHPTTYLMVEAMEKIDFEGKNVLDFGTGTGVLAILAEKLGAQGVIALDNDGWSIENTRENIRANHCSKVEVVLAGEPNIEEKPNVILANINLHILTKFAADLSKLLPKGGLLLASGFLKKDVEEMERSFAEFLLLKECETFKDDWSGLLFKKS